MTFEVVKHRVSIAGRVTDAVKGEPLARVAVVIKGRQAPRQTWTNLAGVFWIEDLPDGEYTITVAVAAPDRRDRSRQRIGKAKVVTRTDERGATPAWVEVTVDSA